MSVALLSFTQSGPTDSPRREFWWNSGEWRNKKNERIHDQFNPLQPSVESDTFSTEDIKISQPFDRPTFPFYLSLQLFPVFPQLSMLAGSEWPTVKHTVFLINCPAFVCFENCPRNTIYVFPSREFQRQNNDSTRKIGSNEQWTVYL